jgi:nucleotide-binding universal stress UspA family protein
VRFRQSANVKLVRILLPITPHGTTENCAATAFSLAERSGAQLEVLHACPPPAERLLPYSTEISPLYFEELIGIGKKQVALEKRQAKKWLGKMARRHPKVHPEFVAIDGLVEPAVARRAKVADLTVLPSVDAEENGFWASARDAALFHSGRPLLVVPKETEGAVGATVVVAWKDTVEAVRAVGAAQPFLAKAKRIMLVSVTERGQDETAAAMADYLTRGGLRVRLVHLASDAREVGEVLLKAAGGEGVLLVMGAYGHWRWWEWVFGGATRYVLRHTTVPVLMMY